MSNTTPNANSTQTPKTQGSHSFRTSVDTSISQVDTQMWKRARLFIRNITLRYTNYADVHSPSDFERDLHNLWYLFIGAARVTDTNTAEADRLAVQVLVARELGMLRGVAGDGQEVKEVKFCGGLSIWIDLPFLSTDLRDTWTKALERDGGFPSDHLTNLAGFIARLVAFGICEVELSLCGLLLLKLALEIPRSLISGSEGSKKDEDTSLAYLMPALLAWFTHGSFKLFGLCARGISCPPEIEDGEDRWVRAGSLLSLQHRDGGRGRISGFSMLRWQFWKQRLNDIAAGEENPLDDSIQGQARRCFNFLDSWERITGGDNHDREMARNVYFDI